MRRRIYAVLILLLNLCSGCTVFKEKGCAVNTVVSAAGAPEEIPFDWEKTYESNKYDELRQMVYERFYNGYRTTDHLVYDIASQKIIIYQNSLENVDLSSIDFDLIKENKRNAYNFDEARVGCEIIALVDGSPTVIRAYTVVSEEDETTDPICTIIDLQTLEDVTDQVDFKTVFAGLSDEWKFAGQTAGFQKYERCYKDISTSDYIVFDVNTSKIKNCHIELENADFSCIDADLVKKNQSKLTEQDEKGYWYYDYITLVNNVPVAIRNYQYSENGIYTTGYIDLQSGKVIYKRTESCK